MVEIVDYKESWPVEFSEIARQLKQGLGTLALRIDHIGSPSVPGLAAKDIIDIQITVAELSMDCLEAMQNMGYTRAMSISYDHRPPDAFGGDEEWEKWYFKPPDGQRKTHIHMRVMGRANQRYPLLFRDYLRAHPATAQAYAELKRRLAESLADPEMYPEVKDPAVDLIYLAAQEWAKETDWEPNF